MKSVGMSMYVSLVIGKLCLMHVRKVSSRVRMCCAHRLIRDETFRIENNFDYERLSVNETFHNSV